MPADEEYLELRVKLQEVLPKENFMKDLSKRFSQQFSMNYFKQYWILYLFLKENYNKSRFNYSILNNLLKSIFYDFFQ
jgi:hypothetical protein